MQLDIQGRTWYNKRVHRNGTKGGEGCCTENGADPCWLSCWRAQPCWGLAGCHRDTPLGKSFRFPLSAEPRQLDPQVSTDAASVTLVAALFEGLAG